MIVSRFAIFTEDVVICCYQVTQIFSRKYSSTIASPARSPCDFRPLADLAISVFREMSFNTVLTPILTSLGCGLYRYFMRRTGVRVSTFRNFIIQQIFFEFLQPLRDFRIQRVSPFFQQRVSPFSLYGSFSWFWEFYWLG